MPPDPRRAGLTEGDVKAIVHPNLDGIVLPKVEGPETVAAAAGWLGEAERERGLEEGRTKILVLVESEPLKRFRYSHIVEATLISHVDKALGLKVDRVFWRFPLPVGASSPQDTADIKPTQREDDYLAEGIREAKTSPEYHVSEDSWEQFEKAQSVEGATPSAPARTDKAGPAQ